MLIGEKFPQLTAELYSCLSAIKKYFVCFDAVDPCIQNPTIKTNLAMWTKLDPPQLQAAVFDDDEPEEFIAYAENSPENLIAKAAALLYLSCVGRKGELVDTKWEDVTQKIVGGKKIWSIKYIREKQTDRPEVAESLLADEISNLAFSLYAGF